MDFKIDNGLIYKKLTNQPREDECWLEVCKISCENNCLKKELLFHVRKLYNSWEKQLRFQNEAAKKIQSIRKK